MLFDPLLDTYTPPVASPWQAIADAANGAIERAAVKRDLPEAFKWLNFMDLLDSECAAYWREWGLDLYGGRNA